MKEFSTAGNLEKDLKLRYTRHTDIGNGKYYNFKGDEIIFEIGAYNGIHAVRLSECVPNGQVVAVEPDVDNYRHLLKNTGIIPNISVYNLACSDKNGKIKMFKRRRQIISKYFFVGWTVPRIPKRVVYEAVTVDWLSDYIKLIPDFVRIQVNGSELDVLDGMIETLKHRPELLVTALYHNNFKGVLKRISNLIDYHTVIINKNILCLPKEVNDATS